MTIDIIIPTYGRPDRMRSVAENIEANTETDHTIWFVVEESDKDSQTVGRFNELNVIINQRTENYAGACNTAFEHTRNLGRNSGDFIFAGADDLNFHPGWDIAALDAVVDRFVVIGTNDLLNPYVLNGLHATHYLVRRDYIDALGGTMDQGPGIWFFEGYDHNYTDTEFIGVAKARVHFRPCMQSVVEHMHFTAGKTPRDATSDRGMRNYSEDRQTYYERKNQWTDLVL